MRIFQEANELSRAASELFVALAKEAIRERGRFLVALSGGSAPTGLYRLLAREPIDWTRIQIFWGDERLVPPENPESNYGQAREVLLKNIPIPSENIHRVATELEPETAAMDYARVLKEYAAPPLDWPRFDLVLLGMGEDGHTASLFPGSPVEVAEPVIAVTANYQGRPAQRVTLTPLVFNAARQALFLITGANKAKTLKGVFDDGNSSERIPAKRIQPVDGQVTWMVDQAAAEKMDRQGS